MSDYSRTRNEDDGILKMVRSVPTNIVLTILFFASLWVLSNYFVTKAQYDRDQGQTTSLLQEMRGDIKHLLEKK